VGLHGAISALPEGLNASVQLQGSNWSAGQRQLLCVARAMLTSAHTFVFDEATANVDMQSDAVIQVSSA
jgi:ABC-type multidrug transport system fused ATPase/permease subunit